MSAAPRAPIQQAPRQVGRTPAVETALQVIEGAFYGAGTEAVYGRGNVEAALGETADRRADNAVSAIEAIADLMIGSGGSTLAQIGHEIKRHCAEYRAADRIEDAHVTQAGYRFGMVLTEVRIGCHSVEMAEAGKGRNRPGRRPTDARQAGLLDGETGEGGGVL